MTKGACSFARVLFVIEPIKHRACRTDVTKLGTSRDVARQDSDALGGTRWQSEALRGTLRHSEALRGTRWASEALSGTH